MLPFSTSMFLYAQDENQNIPYNTFSFRINAVVNTIYFK